MKVLGVSLSTNLNMTLYLNYTI